MASKIISPADGLHKVHERGFRSGFANLLRKELGLFWSTSRWWKHALLWTLIMNGVVCLIYYVVLAHPDVPTDMMEQITKGFYTLGGLAATIGAIFLAQDAVIGERQSGTAAWILSKPASRPAFLLTKFLAQFSSMTAFTVILQSAVLYALVAALTGHLLEPLRLLISASLMTLNLAFYIALTLLLGVLFTTRPPVLAISLGWLLVGPISLEVAPWLMKVIPFGLLDLAAAITWGAPIAEVLPINHLISGLAWPLLFLTLSLYLFQKEEL